MPPKPQTVRRRSAPAKPMALTKEALALHDRIQNEMFEEQKEQLALRKRLEARRRLSGQPDSDDEDLLPLGGNAMTTDDGAAAPSTGAAAPTDPADPFDVIRRQLHSTLPSHRNNVAILAAVEETIAAQGFDRTPTAYFGALVSLLAGQVAEADALPVRATGGRQRRGKAPLNSNDDESAIWNAIVLLLSLIISRVEASVLCARYADLAQLFSKALGHYVESSATTRALLECLARLLGAIEAPMWTLSTSTALVGQMVSLCMDQRPKVRRKAVDTLTALYAGLGPNAVASARPIFHKEVAALFATLHTEYTALAQQASIASAAQQDPLNNLTAGDDNMEDVEAGSNPAMALLSSKLMHLMRLLQDIFKHLGRSDDAFLMKPLLVLDEVYRGLEEDEQPHLQKEIEQTLQAGCLSFGPEMLLASLPLNIRRSEIESGKVSRPWLLYVIRNHIPQGSSMAYFVQNIVSLANDMKAEQEALIANGQPMVAVQFRSLFLQLWALFPGFSKLPSDLEHFRNIARDVGTLIQTEDDLLIDACHGLQALVSSGLGASEERAAHVRAVLGPFAKNYMPLLFNRIMGAASQFQDPLVGTIREYSRLTDPELLDSFVSRCIARLTSAESDDNTRDMMLTLSIAMSPSMNLESKARIFQALPTFLACEDAMLQKRAYRCLLTVSDNVGHMVISSAQASAVLGSLLTLESVSAGAKRDRLRCMLALLTRMDDPAFLAAVPSVMPEAILGCKEVNEKTRRTSYDLLTDVGKRMAQLGSTPLCLENPDASLNGFFKMTIAGLAANSPHMISATVYALSTLVFQFCDQMELSTLSVVIDTILLILKSKTKENVKAAIGFVKVMAVRVPAERLGAHLPGIVEGLLVWADEHSHHFKIRVREIIERLVRKFGYQIIGNLIPAEHQKLLDYIRKYRVRESVFGEGNTAEDNEETMAFDSSLSIGGRSARRLASTSTLGRKRGRGEEEDTLEGLEDLAIETDSEDEAVSVHTTRTARSMARSLKSTQSAKTTKTTATNKTSKSVAMSVSGKSVSGKSVSGKSVSGKSVSGKSMAATTRSSGALSTMSKSVRGKRAPQPTPLQRAMEDASKYKSKRGFGDVKIADQPDPYAYLPLNPMALSKRRGTKHNVEMQDALSVALKSNPRGAKARALQPERKRRRK
ncbi:hypothetical protein H696_00732 [Fonticula alba]|uniref:RRP12 HEAT domain-containing protein n=1 Tax=Fonticula alba TaxID=691883 RepID=A0A058ZFQ5_FONAL|nr:hypothetical protein H696_00732 [Fonticula alba]KCV73189.1 hypothetical protein H696_00732 [Fonticula alba]|eukprot:XP_009492890.1 hypothetical protein H696_00732 [Fonticula alba]